MYRYLICGVSGLEPLAENNWTIFNLSMFKYIDKVYLSEF